MSLYKLNIPLLWARFSSSSFLRFLKAAPDGLDCLFILKVLQMFANYSTTTSIYHQKEPLGCSAHLPLTRLVNKTACRCNVQNCPETTHPSLVLPQLHDRNSLWSWNSTRMKGNNHSMVCSRKNIPKQSYNRLSNTLYVRVADATHPTHQCTFIFLNRYGKFSVNFHSVDKRVMCASPWKFSAK